jgi:hypothetical protein
MSRSQNNDLFHAEQRGAALEAAVRPGSAPHSQRLEHVAAAPMIRQPQDTPYPPRDWESTMETPESSR